MLYPTKKPTPGEWKVIGCLFVLVVIFMFLAGAGLLGYIWVTGGEVPPEVYRIFIFSAVLITIIIGATAFVRRWL